MHAMAIEKSLRSIVLGSIFVLPFIVFIVAQTLFFPFITGKNFAFRLIVEIMTGAYIALALINPAFRPRRSWLLGAFAFFLVVVALADLLGAYPFKSFWSNFERMDGWVTLAHLFAYFVVASAVLNTEKLWRAFLRTELAASVLVGLYGLLQLFGVASLTTGFSSLSRLDATFGNPIYLAVYMLFNIGIAALLLRSEWRDNANGRNTLVLWLYGGALVLDTLILFLTGTRGAMIGLFGGIILGLLLLVFSGNVSQRVSRISLGVIVGVLALAGIFFLLRGQMWIQQVPVVNRLATISVTDSTTKARFYNWSMAWQGVKERPVLGWGQENYAIVFDKYYDPRMHGQEQWFDRVHNIVFDWLVAAGVVGLLSYLSLFGCAFWCIWRPSVERGSTEASRLNVRPSVERGSTEASRLNVRRGDFDPFERSILVGVLVAYFFHNLFVFDNVMSYILFTTILAYIASRSSRGAGALYIPTVPFKYTPIVAALAVLALWGVAWFVNARALSANRALLQALAPHQEGLTKNLEYFERSISYGTFGRQEAREQLTQAASQVAGAQNVAMETRRAFVEAAAREMALQADESPLDARFPLFLGVLLNGVGDLEGGARALQVAHELSPGKQTILFELGANAYARGDVEQSLAYFREAFDLAPDFTDSRLNYAAAAIRAKNDALADELLAPLIPSGQAADPRIAAAYVSRGRYDKVALIWESRVAAYPNDSAAYFTLAAAYYGIGNHARAIAVLEKASTLSPEAKAQADALIKQIRDGTAKLTN